VTASGLAAISLPDVIQRADEFLRSLALPQLDLNQLLFGPLVNRRHSFQEHLGNIVSGPHPDAVDETQEQSVSIRRSEVLQFSGIQTFSGWAKLRIFIGAIPASGPSTSPKEFNQSRWSSRSSRCCRDGRCGSLLSLLNSVCLCSNSPIIKRSSCWVWAVVRQLNACCASRRCTTLWTRWATRFKVPKAGGS